MLINRSKRFAATNWIGMNIVRASSIQVISITDYNSLSPHLTDIFFVPVGYIHLLPPLYLILQPGTPINVACRHVQLSSGAGISPGQSVSQI